MSNVFTLNYVYKEQTVANGMIYSFELTKNQQKQLQEENIKIAKELISIPFIITNEGILKRRQTPEGMYSHISHLIKLTCATIKDEWDRSLGVPVFTVKGLDQTELADEYRNVTVVPFYIDKSLDSVHQFLDWEEILTNLHSFEFIKLLDDTSSIHIRNHREAVSYIRKEMSYYQQFKKERSKITTSVKEVPSSVIHQSIDDFTAKTGMETIFSDVRIVYYMDVAGYRREFSHLHSLYPNNTIYTLPLVYKDKIYTLLFPIDVIQ